MPFSATFPVSEEATVGPVTFERALERLPRDVHERMTTATALSWLRIADMEQLIMACADESGRDVLELNLEMTRLGTERSLRTVWRMLMRLSTDQLILSRTAAAYARAYDRGELRVRIDSRAHGEAQISGRPGVSRMTREAFGLGIETILRLAGRGNVRATSRKTPDGVLYQIRLR